MRASSNPPPPSRGRSSSASILPWLPDSAPPGRRWLRRATRLVQGLQRHNAFATAPAMAFHFFLSLFPMLVLVGFLLGQLVRRRGVEALVAPVLDAVPSAAEDVVRGELERLAGSHAAPLAPISIAGFLWLASSGTHGLMDVFELAVGARPRPWWRQRVMALGWVVAALVLASGVGLAFVRLDAFVRRSDAPALVPSSATNPSSPMPAPSPSSPREGRRTSGRTSERDDPTSHPTSTPAAAPAPRVLRHREPLLASVWERLGAVFLVGLCGCAFLAAFYRFAVEHPPQIRRRAWPGAIAALSTWLAASWGFGRYVRSLGEYTLFYGSVAAVAVLLFWFYLTSWALLLGAEVNAQLEGVRDAPPSAGSARSTA